MVCPDALVKNLEMKIDTLVEQMESRTLMMKKKVEQRPSRTGNAGKNGEDRTCSYCGEYGHIVERCEENPNKDRRFGHCGKKDTY